VPNSRSTGYAPNEALVNSIIGLATNSGAHVTRLNGIHNWSTAASWIVQNQLASGHGGCNLVLPSVPSLRELQRVVRATRNERALWWSLTGIWRRLRRFGLRRSKRLPGFAGEGLWTVLWQGLQSPLQNYYLLIFLLESHGAAARVVHSIALRVESNGVSFHDPSFATFRFGSVNEATAWINQVRTSPAFMQMYPGWMTMAVLASNVNLAVGALRSYLNPVQAPSTHQSPAPSRHQSPAPSAHEEALVVAADVSAHPATSGPQGETPPLVHAYEISHSERGSDATPTMAELRAAAHLRHANIMYPDALVLE